MWKVLNISYRMTYLFVCLAFICVSKNPFACVWGCVCVCVHIILYVLAIWHFQPTFLGCVNPFWQNADSLLIHIKSDSCLGNSTPSLEIVIYMKNEKMSKLLKNKWTKSWKLIVYKRTILKAYFAVSVFSSGSFFFFIKWIPAFSLINGS